MATAGLGEVEADLRARYREPHRRYHHNHHLDAVLRHVVELADGAADLEAVRLAALFHDAVYDPLRADNEAASALLAEQLLPPCGVPPARVAEVARLVRLTATHDPADGDANGAVLCDADLAILGSDPQAYRTYTENIRAEYGHVDDRSFALGRSQILGALLEQSQLFRTAAGRVRWEAAARRNLSAELTALAASASAGQPR